MVKRKKFKPPYGLPLNYDNLYVIPADMGEYTLMYGDTQYDFTKSDVDKMCDEINAVGCTSFVLTKEELEAIIEKIETYRGH